MDNLNFDEFNSMFDFYSTFPTEESCIAYLEYKRWPNGVVSPYDPTSKVYRRGDGKYRCKTQERTSTSISELYLKELNYRCASGFLPYTLRATTKKPAPVNSL